MRISLITVMSLFGKITLSGAVLASEDCLSHKLCNNCFFSLWQGAKRWFE